MYHAQDDHAGTGWFCMEAGSETNWPRECPSAGTGAATLRNTFKDWWQAPVSVTSLCRITF
jgi:hypothetical protein